MLHAPDIIAQNAAAKAAAAAQVFHPGLRLQRTASASAASSMKWVSRLTDQNIDVVFAGRMSAQAEK